MPLVLPRLSDDLKGSLASRETEADVHVLEATHLIGMRIRMLLSLWEENHELASPFPLATHPDSMSTKILVECGKRLSCPKCDLNKP